MSVKTKTDERLEELSDRIDQLEATAQASGAEGQASMSARPASARGIARREKPQLPSARDRLATAVGVELRVDMAQMRPHGVR